MLLSVSPAINSCALGNGGCQHECVQLTVTQHRCQCRPEFQLQEDGKRCVRECPCAACPQESPLGPSYPTQPQTHPGTLKPKPRAGAGIDIGFTSLLGCWGWTRASGEAGPPWLPRRVLGIV